MNILIVDDSSFIQKQIRKIALSVYPDANISLAGNVEEASAYFTDHEFDYITIDFNMPGQTGDVLMVEARERYPHAGLALLTANKQEAIRIKAEESGAEFIGKPDFRDELITFLGTAYATN